VEKLDVSYLELEGSHKSIGKQIGTPVNTGQCSSGKMTLNPLCIVKNCQ